MTSRARMDGRLFGAYSTWFAHGNRLWLLGLNYKVTPLLYFLFYSYKPHAKASRTIEYKPEAFRLTYLRCYSHQVHICRHTDLRCTEQLKWFRLEPTIPIGRAIAAFSSSSSKTFTITIRCTWRYLVDSFSTLKTISTCAGGQSAAVVTLTVYTFYIVNKWLPYVKYNLRET